MTTNETNRAIVTRLYHDVLNKKDLDRLSEFVSPDFTGPNGLTGPDGFKAPLLPLLSGFPDAHWEIESMTADNNKVVVQQIFKGTHSNKFQFFEATGVEVSNAGIAVYEFSDGRIVGARVLTDRLAFLQQLHLVPQDISLLARSEEHIFFIDRFVIPQSAKKEFMERALMARDFLRTLPGFIDDSAYETTDQQGEFVLITIAVWKNEEAVKNAKETVQERYRKEGFDPSGMMKRLNVTMERGVFKTTY